jgi:hypothetical protein
MRKRGQLDPATHAATLTVVAIAWAAVLGQPDAAMLAVVMQRIDTQSQAVVWSQAVRHASPQARKLVASPPLGAPATVAPRLVASLAAPRQSDGPRVHLLNLPPPSA